MINASGFLRKVTGSISYYVIFLVVVLAAPNSASSQDHNLVSFVIAYLRDPGTACGRDWLFSVSWASEDITPYLLNGSCNASSGCAGWFWQCVGFVVRAYNEKGEKLRMRLPEGASTIDLPVDPCKPQGIYTALVYIPDIRDGISVGSYVTFEVLTVRHFPNGLFHQFWDSPRATYILRLPKLNPSDRLSQGDWPNAIICPKTDDGEVGSIARIGCPITSVAMLLRAMGIVTDPQELLEWANEEKVLNGCNQPRDQFIRFARKKAQEAGKFICVKPNIGKSETIVPRILRISATPNTPPGIRPRKLHFVVAIGCGSNTDRNTKILDPGWKERETLDFYVRNNYNIENDLAFVYCGGNLNPSGMLFLGSSLKTVQFGSEEKPIIAVSGYRALRLLVFSEDSLKTGIDVPSGQGFNEIPSTGHELILPVGDDVSGDAVDPITDSETGHKVVIEANSAFQFLIRAEAIAFMDSSTIDFTLINIDGSIETKSFDIQLSQGERALYKMAYDTSGTFSVERVNVTTVERVSDLIPTGYRLDQNFPNPFNPLTTISFAIPKRSSVKLILYNNIGKEVLELVDKELQPGEYSVKFDAKKFSTGIYFYRLTTDEFTQSKKLTLLK